MSNPYQAPVQPSEIRGSYPEVQRPAIALMIVSLVAIIFGIWALVTLGKPGVKDLFEANSQ